MSDENAHSSGGMERSTCKHCPSQVDEDEDVCLDCYIFIHSVNAGFPV